jgi:hypothetical protein
VTDRQTMDLAERRAADRALSEQRREARRDYLRYAEQSAEADREYRKAKARKFVELRAEGEPVESAKIQAEAVASDAKHRRDIAASLAKAALLRVEEAERDSVTVRDIHSSSERVDGLAA